MYRPAAFNAEKAEMSSAKKLNSNVGSPVSRLFEMLNLCLFQEIFSLFSAEFQV